MPLHLHFYRWILPGIILLLLCFCMLGVSHTTNIAVPCSDVSEWKAIMSYYIECRKALLDVGTDIVLDLDDHPFMSEWLKQPNNYNICDWSTWSAE